MPKKSEITLPAEIIEQKIYLIRGHKVMLDSDLAHVYGVTTRRLNEQVRRNIDRFPNDFAFVLTAKEFSNLKSHFATSSSSWGGRRKLPYAFTEHGVVMAANVLNSQTAVRASILVVRTFVRLREVLASHKDLAAKIEALEKKYQEHDVSISQVFAVIKELMKPKPPPPISPKRRIGFAAREDD